MGFLPHECFSGPDGTWGRGCKRPHPLCGTCGLARPLRGFWRACLYVRVLGASLCRQLRLPHLPQVPMSAPISYGKVSGLCGADSCPFIFSEGWAQV